MLRCYLRSPLICLSLLAGLTGFQTGAKADFISFAQGGQFLDLVETDGVVVRFPRNADPKFQERMNALSVPVFKKLDSVLTGASPFWAVNADGTINRPPVSPADYGWFQGRILGIDYGARSGDWFDPANHDRILFQGYDADGRAEGDPISVSGLFVPKIIHEIDGPEDFVFKFSDSHLKGGPAFGSAQHRDAFYALFDPGGESYIRTGSGRPAAPEITGAYYRYLQDGAISPDAYRNMGGWDRHDPRRQMVGQMAGQYAQLNVNQFLTGAARARKYDAVPAEVDHLARQAIGILCTMILADPALVSSAVRSGFDRARQMGTICLKDMNPRNHFAFLETGFFIHHPGHMQVTAGEVLDVMLDIILAEPVFTVFMSTDVTLQDGVGGQIINPVDAGDLYDFSTELISSLFVLAAGEIAGASDSIRSKARQATAHLLSPGEISHLADKESNEIDRRFFRAAIVNLAFWEPGAGESEVNLALDLLCETGWGNIHEIEPWATSLVIKLIGYSDRALDATPQTPPLSNEEVRIWQHSLKTVARMLFESEGDKGRDVTLPEFLELHIEEKMRLLNEGNKEIVQDFLDRLGATRRSMNNCMG